MPQTKVEVFEPRSATWDDVAAWAAVFSAGQRELTGSSTGAADVAQHLTVAHASGRARWAARLGAAGQIVGAAELAAQPHDPRVGFLRLFVAPSHRRQGMGSALLAASLAGASERGFDRVQATVLAGPPGESFALTCRNLHVVLRLARLHQNLDDPVTLQRCRELAAAANPGYEPVHWTGAAPEGLAASFGTVMGHVLDAPGAALQMPPRQWDTTAVRVWESKMTSGGTELLVGAAVHTASGTIVAATVTTVAAAGGPHADQHDTAVLPEHRRRGLARWVKAGQTLRLHEAFPRVREVIATVNQQNLPMIAVNRAIGYDRGVARLLVETRINS